MHARIAERIAMIAKLTPDTTVLEIGPGTGILTRELLKVAGKVIAVEADRELFEKLRADFAPEVANGRLALVYGDIRAFDVVALPEGYIIVANIPYYLTGEIFRMFLSARRQPRAMTLLVQREVAKRVVGNPERSRGTRSGKPYSAKATKGKESILSLSVKAYGTPAYEFTVPRGAFRPSPKVDSAVLTIRDISRKNFRTQAKEKRFFDLIHAGFAHKRKFVRNNLAELISGKVLRAAGVPEGARAEDLPLSAWFSLCKFDFGS